MELERLREDHLEATFQWLGDPSLRAQIDSLDIPQRETHGRVWKERLADRSREDYAILDDDGRHVGNCGLCRIDLKRRHAEMWIYVSSGRRRGLGAGAVRALLARAFEGLALNRVHLQVLANNPNAIAFYRALGFRQEGCLREHTIAAGPVFIDALLFSMLAREFVATGK